MSASAKPLAVTQESDEKRLSLRFVGAGEPVVGRLLCFNQILQFAGL
ncbi:hypothetical protein ESCOCP332M_19465 [Escherichia coli]|nr:hypothetical protein G725_02232 [Escherichia coli HVH 53 (4-0631051)]SPW59095.1 Uncharacterised protein [Escherichia coli]STE40261.1 Uncharacterised protein [Escherichia coli]STG79762.1 Uncharacterised protein [Escherichia coli]